MTDRSEQVYCSQCNELLVWHRLSRESFPRWLHAVWSGPEDNMVMYLDNCPPQPDGGGRTDARTVKTSTVAGD